MEKNMQKLLIPLAGLLVLGLVTAWSASLNVQSCSVVSGTVTVSNCLGLNLFDSNQDIRIAKNGIVGLTMSDYNSGGTINGVNVTLRHSGQAGITGTLGITLYDSVAGVAFCAEDNSVANTTSFTTNTITGCTPSGGWDTNKLNNLEVRVKNNDTGTSQRAWLSYLVVDVNYS